MITGIKKVKNGYIVSTDDGEHVCNNLNDVVNLVRAFFNGSLKENRKILNG